MPRNSKITASLVGAGLVAAVYVGVSLFSEYNAKHVVQQNIERLRTRAEASGWKAEITYDTLSVQKLAWHPQVSLENVHAVFTHNTQGRVLDLHFPELQYHPTSVSMRSYEVALQGDVRFVSSDHGKAGTPILAQFVTPPVLEAELLGDGTRGYHISIPKKTVFVEENHPEKTLTAVIGGDALAEWRENAAGVNLYSRLHLADVTWLAQEEPVATWQSLATEMKTQIQKGDVFVFASSVSLDGLEFLTKEGKEFSPIHFASEMQYTGPEWQQAQAHQFNAPMHWKVGELSLSSGLVNINVNGAVDYEPDDERLPYGKLTIRIENVDKLNAYIVRTEPRLQSQVERWSAALSRLSGMPVVMETPQTVVVERAKKGHLQVGKLSMEEAFALGLGLFMQAQQPAVAPDAATTPESATPETNAPEGITPEVKGLPQTPIPPASVPDAEPAQKTAPAAD